MATISDEYRLQLQEMHQPDEDGRTWGATAVRKIFKITEWIRGADVDLGEDFSILDYGSADGKFKKGVERRGAADEQFTGIAERITNYDPAIPEYWDTPEPHDFVMCIDVLEHIEPEYLEKVLEDLHRVTKHRFLFHIAMYFDDTKTLPDGRNPHLIVEDENWWKNRLAPYFDVKYSQVFWGKAAPHRKTLEVYGNPKKVS